MELLILLLILYFVPTVVAALRHHNVTGVTIVNVLLGWSVVGWVVALVMACGNNKPQVVIHQQQAPPQIEP